MQKSGRFPHSPPFQGYPFCKAVKQPSIEAIELVFLTFGIWCLAALMDVRDGVIKSFEVFTVEYAWSARSRQVRKRWGQAQEQAWTHH